MEKRKVKVHSKFNTGYMRFESSYKTMANCSIGQRYESPEKGIAKINQYEYKHNPDVLRFAKIGASLVSTQNSKSHAPSPGRMINNSSHFKSSYQEISESLNKKLDEIRSNPNSPKAKSPKENKPIWAQHKPPHRAMRGNYDTEYDKSLGDLKANMKKGRKLSPFRYQLRHSEIQTSKRQVNPSFSML
ncbi:unnamed protein product [Moneuplotes crassus]|uniref:Uncharacterized protein n=1 Tax=Euplotes crassus TaxID=5936 RepID=A0AAD1XVK6_EUPCR|nr:unnamed protein product [Moneuplotes crassus]